MKKKILYTLLFCFAFASCVKDTGNYNYLNSEDVLPINIVGPKDDITVVQEGQLKISPEIENMDNENRYKYIWYTTEAQTAGALPVKTVLSTTKNLDAKIMLDAGSYFLNFMVIDEKLDLYKRKQVRLEVSASDITTGWYILKDNNNETDFDYINTLGEMNANILAKKGNQLKGKAVRLSYQSGRYYHTITSSTGVVTTLANQKAFHILSTQDIRTFNAQNMILFKKYEQEFYSSPATCQPQFILSESNGGDAYLLNSGKLYSIYGMSSNIGKFGAPKVGNYSLFPVLIPINYYGDVLVFDNLSNTFYTASAAGTSINLVDNQTIDGKVLSLKNMPYKMISMFAGSADINSSTRQAFALMKSTENGSFCLAQIPYQGSSIISSFNQIDANALITQSTVMAAPSSGNFVYFALKNKAYYYMNATGLDVKEKLLVTLPDNEEITYMNHVYTKDMNILAILSSTGTNWKLYLYPIQAVGNPELESAPQKVYSGTGVARYLTYRNK